MITRTQDFPTKLNILTRLNNVFQSTDQWLMHVNNKHRPLQQNNYAIIMK